MKRVDPADIDVLVLCGGIGKRLQSVVNDRPKPMAKIGGRPFLDILVSRVASFGFRRFILCTGYMADSIRQHYQDGEGSLEIVFSEEKTPLGTGGAIGNAGRLIKSLLFLVLNGDSLCDVDLKKFLRFHRKTRALCSIVLAYSENSKDYGNVALGQDSRVTQFDEKAQASKDSFVSAGIYLFQKQVLSFMPVGNFSLEKDLFPAIVGRGFYGYISDKGFIDIGTPQKYMNAQWMLRT